MIRIAITSDLHFDPSHNLTSPYKIEAMVAEIQNQRPDAVVIAGDLAHGLSQFIACLELFRVFDVPVAVIAGNHDIWRDQRGGHSSLELWEELLPDAVRRAGAVWLEDENLILPGAAICGSMLWYDYSALDPGLIVSIEELAARKSLMHGDAYWIDWPYTDIELSESLLRGLTKRLNAASARSDVKDIVLVTHIPIVEQQMLRKPHDPGWGFTNAYFGNMTAGKLALGFEKLRIIVSGHTHIGRQAQLERDDAAPVMCYVLPSDYGNPTYMMLEL